MIENETLIQELVKEVKGMRLALATASKAPPKAVDKEEATRILGIGVRTLDR